MNLNTEQILAVSHYKGPCVVTAVPGSGKCITGDSWVFSNNQLLSSIQDNSVSSVLGLNEEDLNTVRIEPNKVGAFVDSGVKPVVRITTHHGFSICGTEHHPIVVLNDEGNLVWKCLSEVRVGDFAAIWCNKNCETYAVADSMTHPNFSKGCTISKVDYSYYLMGLLLGDGSLSIPKCVSFCCQSELKSSFLFLIKEVYGEKVSEYRDKRREDLWNLYVFNKVKKDLIEQFGDIEHGSCDKYLTPKMLSGDKYQIAALIRGLFDTDGHAGDNSCEMTLCSQKLIDQLHLLLLHYGVFSYKSVKTVDDNEYYRIQIHGEDYRRFVRNIGFGISYKKERSKEILQKKSNPNKAIPHMMNVLKRLRGEIRDFSWWDGHTATVFSGQDSVCMNRYLISGNNSRNLTETSAMKIVDICETNNFESKTVSYLKSIAENLCFSQVKSSSMWHTISFFEEHVYDYEVPKSHSFIANGFINHNTRVLTSRVISLVNKHKIEPRNILCLTFTNKAANEMKERIASDLGEVSGKVWVSTFHRLCLAVLRKHGSLIDLASNFSVYSSKEQDELMTKLARMHEYESTSKSAIQKLTKAVNDFREDIVDFEQHLQELNHIEVAIIQDYQEYLDRLNAVDFSGMLYKAWLIMKNNPAVSESMGKRFQYVLVDEFQDTNHVQYDIVRRIATHKNLFVVGDFQQSIYGWRGAKPENLANFKEEYPGLEEITLPRNYRSTSPILQGAQNLIRNNDDAHAVELLSDRGSGPGIKVESFFDPEQEAARVADSIQLLKNSAGYDWKDFAILYRANSLSRSPEMALRSRSIPYRILGGFSFFDRTEIKTTLSYLSFLANPHDSINFARAITNPKRGIGNDTIGKLEKVCEQTEDTIATALRSSKMPKISSKAKMNLDQFLGMMDKYKKMEGEVPLNELTEGLMRDSGYYEQVKSMDKNEDSHKSREENLDEFIAGIAEFESSRDNPTIADYLQSIQLLTNDDREDADSEDSVKLLTMHSSKGLEWPCVYVIGVERGYLPHAKADDKGIDEERRLLYVAMTRARDILFLTHCRFRRRRPTGPSFFLDEI